MWGVSQTVLGDAGTGQIITFYGTEANGAGSREWGFLGKKSSHTHG